MAKRAHPKFKLPSQAKSLVDLCFGPGSSAFDGADKAYAEITEASAAPLARLISHDAGNEFMTREHSVVDLGCGTGIFLVCLGYALQGT
jgi:ubiquinone/menaquinone biosynthesis C-methylase UbiE